MFCNLGQVLVNGSSRLSITRCDIEVCTVCAVQLFVVFGCQVPVVAARTLGIRDEKKQRRSLLSRAAGKLEEGNLFRIRKWNNVAQFLMQKNPKS
jgi:hypothetical protein